MNKSPLTSQKPWYKRPIWIIVIFFVIVLTGANGWLLYKDSHPQSYINFTQYEPTKIVDGLQIKNKTLNVWNSTLFSSVTVFVPYSIDLNLGLSRQDSSISEGQDKGQGYNVCSDVGVTCSDLKTTSGQTYQLILYHDPNNLQAQPLVYDKLTTEQAIFIKNGTRIQINIENKDSTPIAEKDWSDMIDSFKPTTFNDLQVKHMHPGP